MSRTFLSLIEAECLRYKLLGERASRRERNCPFLLVSPFPRKNHIP